MVSPSKHTVVRVVEALQCSLRLRTFVRTRDDDERFVRTHLEISIGERGGERLFRHRSHIKLNEFQSVAALPGVIDGVAVLEPLEATIVASIDFLSCLQVFDF